MKKFFFLLLLGLSIQTYGQDQTHRIAAKTEIDVNNFSELVKGQVPALGLSTDQLTKVRAIFTSKNKAAAGLDPYKIGKLKSAQEYQILELDALKDALKVLTVEQKLAYKKNKEALSSGD